MEASVTESLARDAALFGTSFLVLTAGTILFAVRAIRLINAEGRADRKTVWRLAMLRVFAVIAGLSGGLTVILAFATMLCELFGVTSLFAGWGSPRSMALFLLTAIPILTFGMVYGGIAFTVGNDGREVWRSFPALRWFSDRNAAISSAIRQWPPVVAVVAFVRKYDRPLW